MVKRRSLAIINSMLLLAFGLDTASTFSRPTSSRQTATNRVPLFATSTTTDELKSQVLVAIEPTRRGLSADASKKLVVETKIRALEAKCPIKEPARDARMAGEWEVLYTTAPPPSNGQLGPFVGVAKQDIDLVNKTYKNILEVGRNNNIWLSAVLQATWEEWDGSLLEEKNAKGNKEWKSGVIELENDQNPESDDSNGKALMKQSPLESFLSIFSGDKKKDDEKTLDQGATSWKVDFKTITIIFFGIPLLKNTFPDDTARVWKMSYLDDDTRIVRAGRTGKAEDDVVFYMVRDNAY